MTDILDKNKENINEERIQNLLILRKKKVKQKIFSTRLRKLYPSDLNKKSEKKTEDVDLDENENIKNKEKLIFNIWDYLIDPEDDFEVTDLIKKMDFVETENIIKNITILLNDKDNLNSILYGLLMMRKLTVIDAILINKSELFIENKLYIQICNLLFDYYNKNKKLVFESLWILSTFVYDSKDEKIYDFLINNKRIDLYKKILFYNYNNKVDLVIFLEEICTLILNLLIFKEKENEKNILNIEFDEDYLINFLNYLVDLIIKMKLNKEIYLSFFIEITNCFDFNILIKNGLLNKIIVFLIEENIRKLGGNINYNDDDINMYYGKYNKINNYKSKIRNIHHISLIQLQYILSHSLKEIPFNYFQKLSNEIIQKKYIYLDDKINNIFYVGYINSYISYISELNIIISYDETKNLFDYLISNINYMKNQNYTKTKIIIECIEGLNILSLKMILNKMFDLLDLELPNILLFIENDFTKKNHKSIEIINEILNLLKSLLIEKGITFQNDIENKIFINIRNC